MVLSDQEPRFVALGKGVYFFQAEDHSSVDPSHPTLIKIFGWMGAQLPHLHKYTSMYREKYPNTAIILVRAEPSFFWTPAYQREKAFSTVVDILEGLGCIAPANQTQNRILPPSLPLEQHRILIHSFSNGGCFQLITLGKILSVRQPESSTNSPRCTASAIIFDSCPGNASYTATRRAFASVISHPVMRILMNLLVTCLFCIQLVLKHVFRKKPVIDVMRAKLNGPKVLPWLSRGTPRLYLYSEGDEMVAAEAVEKHMEDAKANGLNVSSEKFGRESKHVAHARTDPQRYWVAINRLWKEALDLGGVDLVKHK
ncbi:Transmembrane protein 53-B [Leucoagaricus sp. SymC.cos]|nr:Transmembrane protein 53-B [Leucoagaricus sp. SymC.cos]